MDGWPIGYKLAKPLTSPESERAKKRKVDKVYDPRKRVRTLQAAWLVGRKWLARDGSMFCKTCRLNVHQHADPGRFNVGTSSFQITSIKSHEARMARASSAHGPRKQRALNAQLANGSGQMTMPIKSDGVSCFPSYRSREETSHTRVIQHANQERKCDVSESVEEYSCSCCWWSRRQRQKQRATHPGPCFCWRGCCRNTHTLSIIIPSGLPYTLRLWVGRKSCRPNAGIAGIDRFQEKKTKKDNKLGDDEEELMVAFLEANKMLWEKKATQYMRPDLKNTAWQKQADTMSKEVAHLQCWFKGM